MLADPQDSHLIQPASCGGKRMRLSPAPSHGGKLVPDLLVWPHRCWTAVLEAATVIVSDLGLWQPPLPGFQWAEAWQPWTCWLEDPHFNRVSLTGHLCTPPSFLLGDKGFYLCF